MAFWKGQRGSVATEYMLVISVVVVGVTAAGYVYVPGFQDGTAALSRDVSSILASGDIGGIGTDRDQDGSSGGKAGTSGNGTSASAPTNSQNCTGTFIQNCSAQTAGVGGDVTGKDGQVLSGASTTAVATLVDPNASRADKAAARQEVLDKATANCSQVFLASVTGKKTDTVTVETVANGLTVPDTMKINLPFFGFSFGKIPTDYKGFMSLDQMQAYLGTQGVNATVTKNVTPSQIGTALSNGQKVGVIIDVDSNGNPTATCGGKCGHTVKVTKIEGDTVTIKDRNGTRHVPLSDFQNALTAQGGGMIAVTPKSKGGGWAWNH